MEQVLQNLIEQAVLNPLVSLVLSILGIVLALVGYKVVTAWETSPKVQEHRELLQMLQEAFVPIAFRIAFPESGDVRFQDVLDEYTQKAEEREASGLSWVDPRMLYAVDRLETLLANVSDSRGRRIEIDFNVLLDLAEGYYQQLKQQGAFEDRTDNDLL